jgi:hypothetical protein
MSPKSSDVSFMPDGMFANDAWISAKHSLRFFQSDLESWRTDDDAWMILQSSATAAVAFGLLAFGLLAAMILSPDTLAGTWDKGLLSWFTADSGVRGLSKCGDDSFG